MNIVELERTLLGDRR